MTEFIFVLGWMGEFISVAAVVSGECLEQPANVNASNVSAISNVWFFIFTSETTNSHKSCALMLPNVES
jgi:hypothetical protein